MTGVIHQRPTALDAGAEADRVPAIVHDVLRSPGRPLDPAVRAEMEPRWGFDFSRVRVHSGERAAESARTMGAAAYAAGRHVVLGASPLPSHVLAHELAHVVQDGGGDVLPQRIAAGDSPGERQAHAAEHGPRPTRQAPGLLHRYRSKSAFNFGKGDKAGPFVEDTFQAKTDKATKPWIEKITVSFTSTATDAVANETMPTGTLTGTYFANSAKLADITTSVSGGLPSLGLTDRVTNEKVGRMEGIGYNDKPLGKTLGEGPGTHYAKPDASGLPGAASMHWALFFKGPEAIHMGLLDRGSHACVHVDNPPMQQLNYHTVSGLTTVNVSYASAALDPVCCARMAHLGVKKKGGAPNPCDKSDPAACGGAKKP